MAKPPVVYPVSADLSALLGTAVDVDAAWAEPLGPPAVEVLRRMSGLEALRAFAHSHAMVTDIPEDAP